MMASTKNDPHPHGPHVITYSATLDVPEETATLLTDLLVAERLRRGTGVGAAFTPPNEVFSTDWSFGGGEDKRCGDDGTDSSWAESDSVQGLPAGLEQGDAAFTWSA